MAKCAHGGPFQDPRIKIKYSKCIKIFHNGIYNMNKYIVEFLGTVFFVYIIFATGNYLAIGAALALAVYIGGPISGGMFNPAVSIAMMSAGKLDRNDLIPYIIAQVAGGLGGYELSRFVTLPKM